MAKRKSKVDKLQDASLVELIPEPVPGKNYMRLRRTRRLTKAEAARDNRIRKLVEKEFPPQRHPLKVCCRPLRQELRKGQCLTILTNEPFTTNKITPALYILSYGGHAGFVQVLFCPFCGSKVETIKRKA